MGPAIDVRMSGTGLSRHPDTETELVVASLASVEDPTVAEVRLLYEDVTIPYTLRSVAVLLTADHIEVLLRETSSRLSVQPWLRADHPDLRESLFRYQVRLGPRVIAINPDTARELIFRGAGWLGPDEGRPER